MPTSKVKQIEEMKGKYLFSDFKQGKMHLGPVFKNVSISHFWWRVQCETQEILIFLLHVSKPTDLNNGLKNCFTHQFWMHKFCHTHIFALQSKEARGDSVWVARYQTAQLSNSLLKEIVFCCYNFLDLPWEKFFHVWVTSSSSRTSVSKRSQILGLRPRTCTTFSQHNIPALKNWEKK